MGLSSLAFWGEVVKDLDN